MLERKFNYVLTDVGGTVLIRERSRDPPKIPLRRLPSALVYYCSAVYTYAGVISAISILTSRGSFTIR
jgi:hypothetical protein